MQKALLLLVCLLTSHALHAQKVCVGLFFDVPIKELTFTSLRSEYTLWTRDTALIAILDEGKSMTISCVDNLLKISGGGRFREISAIAGDVNGKFSLKPQRPALSQRTYAQNVVLKAVRGNIVVINKLDEDYYLAGVCEAEAGCAAPPAYYKVQAIMSRTYLYSHFDKHATDGFNLCDGVHCQAYKGLQSQCQPIRSAVAQTDGILVIDRHKKPIAPTYSANCGGQTSNSEDVWRNKLPYLRSTPDAYCRHSRSAAWTKRIPVSQWRAFLAENGLYASSASDYIFEQPSRKKYYSVGSSRIELTKIRQRFALRSTFFSVSAAGNDIVLSGRGYGHGVGVCQEGAMAMAAAGMSHRKILQHYYRRTDILQFHLTKPHAYMLYQYGDIFNPWLGRMPLPQTREEDTEYIDEEDT